jgi:hypothetical protein
MNLKSIGDSALQVLKTVAPTIAMAASGPFAPLVGPLIAKIFGTDPSDPKAAEAALLTATPDQLLALKKAEQDFQIQLETLEISKDQLAYADTANARNREINVKDYTNRILAYGVILATFFLEGYLVVRGMPNMDAQMAIVLGRVLGTFDTASALVLSYYFGSSAGSSSKDSTIRDLTSDAIKK